MALDTTSSLAQPQPQLELDAGKLLAHLQRHLPEALAPRQQQGSTQLVIKQFSHGQSNPTYLLTGPALHKPLVLRKKPPGKILPSAHSVEREHQVLAALARRSSVPVPRPLLLCEEPAVIGTPFYIMEFAQGHIFVDCNLPGVSPSTRHCIYRQMVSALAALHGVDVEAAGLASYGNPASYCSRQLKRWATQYRACVDPAPPSVARLVSWLQANVPAQDADLGRAVVCHGDYRLDNLVFRWDAATSGQSQQQQQQQQQQQHASAGAAPACSGDPQLLAVLDWELSTLGNRWADVAYMCLPYHLPPDMAVLKSLRTSSSPNDTAVLPPGIPSEQVLVAMYCQAAGVSAPSEADWAFYLALSLFRLVAILAGVQVRARQGNASSRTAAAVSSDAVLEALTQAALAVIDRAQRQQQQQQPPASAVGVSGSANSASSSSSAPPAGDVLMPLPPHVADLKARLQAFMAAHVMPAEATLEEHSMGPDRWTIHPLMEQLKAKAKAEGLWNLWLPGSLASKCEHLLPLVSDEVERRVLLGARLSHWEYAHLCEVMGRSLWAPEVFNCGAPDTGNMEVLAKYGSPEQQRQWLLPLLQGHIRSCFAMTEKAVASSDATNIQSSIVREAGAGGQGWYVLNGVKWWTSGACDPRCKVAIFMGKTDPGNPKKHLQQSMILVPFDAPGVRVVRPMLVFGYDDAPHGHAEVVFDNVRVPASNLILGEGRGFEIAQGRLGPGRLHHCMRLIGLAERSMELMVLRAQSRVAFGKTLASHGALKSELAKCRIELDAARLLVLHASACLDRVGNKAARGALAAAKVAAPHMAQRVVDTAMQVHGAAGVSQDTVLARLYTGARTLRIADGPDEVHLGTIAQLELARVAKAAKL